MRLNVDCTALPCSAFATKKSLAIQLGTADRAHGRRPFEAYSFQVNIEVIDLFF
jgi:hypothetical protein